MKNLTALSARKQSREGKKQNGPIEWVVSSNGSISGNDSQRDFGLHETESGSSLLEAAWLLFQWLNCLRLHCQRKPRDDICQTCMSNDTNHTNIRKEWNEIGFESEPRM